MSNRKKLIIMVITFSLILILSSSFALLRSTRLSQNNYVINVGDLKVNFQDTKTNALTASNMYPMTDEEGKEVEQELVFTVKNEGTVKAYYNVSIEETSTNPEFKTVIKYLVKKDTNDYNSPVLLSENKYVDSNAILEPNGEATYHVKVYLAENADNTYMGKTFTGKVHVEASQKSYVTPASEIVKEKLNEENSITDDKGIIYLSGTNEDINFNYVWYSGKLWRITQINPDGTMKMITENAITGIYFGETADFENSWAYDWLNEDFLDTLYNYQDIIVTDAKWELTSNYGTSNHPEPYKIVETAVGLLNTYEYYRSYEKINTDIEVEKYQKLYLNNGHVWWLSSSCHNTLESTCIFAANAEMDNSLWGGDPNDSALGIRPAIVLKSDIRLEHSGTLEDPFTIKADKRKGYEGEKLNERLSGEYVKVDNRVYRIVGIENGTTKLTSVDYVRDENGDILNKQYGSPNNARNYKEAVETNNSDYWGVYLNKTWITPNLRKYLVNGTYYMGITMIQVEGGNHGSSYKDAICQDIDTKEITKKCAKTEKNWTGLVGLPRIGEMFAFPLDEDNKNSQDYYLITQTSETGWYFYIYSKVGDTIAGSAFYESKHAVRPSITINSNATIAIGKGTKQSPYEIKCDNCNT